MVVSPNDQFILSVAVLTFISFVVGTFINGIDFNDKSGDPVEDKETARGEHNDATE